MAPHVSRKVILILSLISTALGSSLEKSISQQNFEENFKREFASQLELIENQNVGCLYDKDVCSIEDNCMDDGLFGTCIAQYSEAKFTYRLPPELQRDLGTILSTLLERNYTWHDRYTQCCVRAALICGSMEMPTDLTVCRNFERVEPSSSSSVPDENFFDRLAKRLELLQRKKYEYELGIPEKRRQSELDVEAAALDEAEQILENWQERRQKQEEKFANFVRAMSMKRETDDQQTNEVLPLTKTNHDEKDLRPDDNLLLPAEFPENESPERSPENADRARSDQLTPELVDEQESMNEENEDEASRKMTEQPPPPPPPPPPPSPPPQSPGKQHHDGRQIKHPHQRVRIHRLQLRQQLAKRQGDPAFIDGSYLWVRFDKASSLRESKISGFISRLNRLSGRPLVGEEFSINTSNSEVYFQLTPHAHISDIQKIFDNKTKELSTNGKMKWSSYGFGKPQNRVEASELVEDPGQQARITSTLLVCGLVLVMIAALFVVFLVQRVRSSKWRLRDFVASSAVGGDSDYRDLCRQRMTEKSGEQREPVSAAAQQIAAAKPASGSPNSSTGSWTDDPITTDMDITTGHLILSYMEDYLSNKEKLEQEWAGLCSYEADQSSSAAAAQPENAAKNRYPDLLPYDHSRVILRKAQNATGSDYINASNIFDSDPKVKAYILTQGPMADTATDFWQMVWEFSVTTIVNLTRQLSADGNRELCAQYWPSEGLRLFHRFEVHLVSEHIWCEDFVVRNFYLKNVAEGEARTVTMFHFLTWAEDELPPSAKSLLDFRRKVNKSYKGRASPLVIHCNDGCGRTGTYCLLDLALNRINKGVKEIDLAASLEHLRDQRAGLVKTEDQFEFVITAIAEEVHNVLKTLPQ